LKSVVRYGVAATVRRSDGGAPKGLANGAGLRSGIMVKESPYAFGALIGREHGPLAAGIFSEGNAMTMRDDSLGRDLALGFVAGALAVPTFLEFMIFVLTHAGMINGTLYSMKPVPPMGVPTVINQSFWGGIWGLVFVAIIHWAPSARPIWLVGLLLGAIALPMTGWFIVAPLKHQPMAAGWNTTRMLASVLINGGWGIGIAIIFMILRNLVGARSLAHG
jgi:hypothetical protein